MAFLLRHGVLTPVRSLAIELDPATKVLPATALFTFREADQIVDDARQQAATILSGAAAEFESERQRGYEAGLDLARREQAEKMIEHVSRTVDYLAGVETRMVDLVMGAVQKIVADFDDTERVLIVVRNALSVVRNQKQMTLRLHPSQVDTVRAHVSDLLSNYPGVTYLDLVGDARVQADACILESEIGLVEASIEDQLAAIGAAFARILGSRS